MVCHWRFFAIFVPEMGAFQFKWFNIEQDRCAMKVGTDGVLLGAWADGGVRILDIGTGTGLIALMMAQRFPEARVSAVEIDADAYAQALMNVQRSPFSSRIDVFHDSIQRFADRWTDDHPFDAIVCNPPFFENSLKNSDARDALARHNDQLSWNDLAHCVDYLLGDGGTFSVILPLDAYDRIVQQIYSKGFKECRNVKVKTTAVKPVKRILASFTKNLSRRASSETQLLMQSSGARSEWYQNLTKDFYIK